MNFFKYLKIYYLNHIKIRFFLIKLILLSKFHNFKYLLSMQT